MLLIAIFLGVVFVASGASKLLAPAAAAASLEQTMRVSPARARRSAHLLGASESMLGVAVAVTGLTGSTFLGPIAVAATAMVGGLTAYLVVARRKKAGCGCSARGDQVTWRQFVRNAGLAVSASSCAVASFEIVEVSTSLTAGAAGAIVAAGAMVAAMASTSSSRAADEEVIDHVDTRSENGHELATTRRNLLRAAGIAVAGVAAAPWIERVAVAGATESGDGSDAARLEAAPIRGEDLRELALALRLDPRIQAQMLRKGRLVDWDRAEAMRVFGIAHSIPIEYSVVAAPIVGGGWVALTPDMVPDGAVAASYGQENWWASGTRSGTAAASDNCVDCNTAAISWTVGAILTGITCILALIPGNLPGAAACGVGIAVVITGLPDDCQGVCTGTAGYLRCIAVNMAFCQGVSCGCSGGPCSCQICDPTSLCSRCPDGTCFGAVGSTYCMQYYRDGRKCGCVCCCPSNFGFRYEDLSSTEVAAMEVELERLTNEYRAILQDRYGDSIPLTR